MAYTTVDYIVSTIVILFGLAVFYKALKEPLDIVFGWIRDFFVWLGGLLFGGTVETTTTLKYD